MKKIRSQFVLDASEAKAKKDAAAELSWQVGEGPEAFVVNLSSFLPQNDMPIPSVARAYKLDSGPENRVARNIRTPRPALISELAPSIRSWSEGRRYRTVLEGLSQLRWLFYFLDETEALHPSLPTDLTVNDLSTHVAVEFSDWLRMQKSISSCRMDSVYSTVSAQLALHRSQRKWPPSPFSKSKRPGEALENTPAYSQSQYVALLQMAKLVIRTFMKSRTEARHIFREVEKEDPGRRPAYQAQNRKRWKYQLRNSIAEARDSLARGVAPRSAANNSWSRFCIVPNGEFVSAIFLLAMIRTGVNEQPLLDLVPGKGLRPGPWLKQNPFNEAYRTVLAWKNRSGNRRTQKRIPLGVRAKPTFYPVKLLRYQELLGRWCRSVIDVSTGSNVSSKPFKLAAQRYRDSFWIHFDHGKWRALTGHSTHRQINSLIARYAADFPDLLDGTGAPIRYSAKAIRDAYLEFVAKTSGFSIPTAQMELAHSPHSGSILHYLSKSWARTYANNAIRELHSATNAILQDPSAKISPEEIRRHLGKTGEDSEQKSAIRVRNGFYCSDPSHPPKHIHIIANEGDVCPAANCHDCAHARCFVSSLPELAHEILNLRERRDQLSLHLWRGSDADTRLRLLEEILDRFPEAQRLTAFIDARSIDIPLLEYSPK